MCGQKWSIYFLITGQIIGVLSFSKLPIDFMGI